MVAALSTPVPFPVLVLPFANFILDTTFTLFRRLIRRVTSIELLVVGSLEEAFGYRDRPEPIAPRRAALVKRESPLPGAGVNPSRETGWASPRCPGYFRNRVAYKIGIIDVQRQWNQRVGPSRCRSSGGRARELKEKDSSRGEWAVLILLLISGRIFIMMHKSKVI